MDIAGLKIINVYKLLSSHLLTTSLLVFPSPSVYAGDFDSQHVQWVYKSSTSNGECLVEWVENNNLMLLHNPKGAANFTSRNWNIGTNPDLAFTSAKPDNRLPDRCVIEKFPQSQHWTLAHSCCKTCDPSTE